MLRGRNLHFHGDQSKLKWSHTHARWKQDRFQSINRHHYVSMHSMRRLPIGLHFASRRAFKGTFRAKRRINAGQLNERKGEGARGLESLGHDLGSRRRGKGRELNKCLPAERYAFQYLKLRNFREPQNDIIRLPHSRPFLRLSVSRVVRFFFLCSIHTYAFKFI